MYLKKKDRLWTQKCGKIRGIAYGGVNIFMGIDYAKAKMESLLISQLELIKDINKDQD